MIFEVTPNKRGGGHFGGRMAFLSDGTLLLSVGEGYTLRTEGDGAISLDHAGKSQGRQCKPAG